MTSPTPSPEKPARSTWQTLLLVMVWLVGGILALFGLVYLGCGGACV